jgi:hypothetical protein
VGLTKVITFKIFTMVGLTKVITFKIFTMVGLTKVITFKIFTMVGLTKIFRNVFWTRQNKFPQVSLTVANFCSPT